MVRLRRRGLVSSRRAASSLRSRIHCPSERGSVSQSLYTCLTEMNIDHRGGGALRDGVGVTEQDAEMPLNLRGHRACVQHLAGLRGVVARQSQSVERNVERGVRAPLIEEP